MKTILQLIKSRYEQPATEVIYLESGEILCTSWSDGSLGDTSENWNDMGTI